MTILFLENYTTLLILAGFHIEKYKVYLRFCSADNREQAEGKRLEIFFSDSNR